MSERTDAVHTEPPAHFIIRLGDGQYAICQRSILLAPGEDSEISRFVDSYIQNHPVPAAILPISIAGPDRSGESCEADGLTGLMARYQTGKLVINIDNK